MNSRTLTISPVDFSTADDSLFAMADLLIGYRRFTMPEDPALSREAVIKIYQNFPDFLMVKGWGAWEQDRMIAFAMANFNQEDPADRTLNFRIVVKPEYRRHGLGRSLLAKISEQARENEREYLVAETIDRDLDGAEFLERLGAKRGLEMKINQLDLQTLDRGLLSQWQARAAERAGGFTLGFWDDEYPEADLDQATELYNEGWNAAPHDDLDAPESHFTPENLRQLSKMFHERGNLHRVDYVRETATNTIAGLSEVTWHPEQPTTLDQWATVVRDSYRNHGLGRWLKAAMLESVLRDLPQVRYVRTGNANSNAAMLKINLELGFKPFIATTVWQAGLAQVQAFIHGG